MNLRQKNKKLKQELDRLKSQTVPVKFETQQHTIIPLRSLKQYNRFEYAMCDLDIVKRTMFRDLIEGATDYVTFKQYFDPVSGNVIIQADLSVVDMRKEN